METITLSTCLPVTAKSNMHSLLFPWHVLIACCLSAPVIFSRISVRKTGVKSTLSKVSKDVPSMYLNSESGFRIRPEISMNN